MGSEDAKALRVKRQRWPQLLKMLVTAAICFAVIVIGGGYIRNRLVEVAPFWIAQAAVLVLAVVVALAALLAWERELIFLPTSAATEWLPAPQGSVDVTLHTADSIRLHAWWCPLPGSSDTILYCHGNAGNLSHRNLWIQDWQEQLGVSVLIFDYPGYGRSEGTPNEAGCYAAGEAAWQWLVATQGVQADNIILFGKSLGAAVAIELALRHSDCRALVVAKGFLSIPDMAWRLLPLMPVGRLIRNRFDNLARIRQVRIPTLFAYGTEDRLMTPKVGKRLYAEAVGEPKVFIELEGEGHDDSLGAPFFTAVRQFLALRKEEAGTAGP